MSVDFARSLNNRNATEADISRLEPELRSNITTLRASGCLASSSYSAELDAAGTELWNHSARLIRGDAPTSKGVLCLFRVFAFCLLHSCHAAQGRKIPNNVRILKTAIKTAKSCLDAGNIDIAQRVLESGAECEGVLLGKLGTVDDDLRTLFLRLRAEYLTLRIALAWKQDRLETAEAMFNTATSPNTYLQAAAVEALADLLFEIGKDLVDKKDHYAASKWLDKAHAVLEAQEREQLSSDADELELSILHYLIRALLKSGTDTCVEKAEQKMILMEGKHEGKLVLLLLRLEFITAAASFNAERYFDVLHRIIRTVHITPGNYKTIMSCIHKLKAQDPKLAAQALEDFLTLRLFADLDIERIEKALITRIWLFSQEKIPMNSGHEPLHVLLSTYTDKCNCTLGIAATNAAQTLLWKTINHAFSQQQFVLAERWCEILLHSVFANAGDSNRGKIQRRKIACALALQDTQKARQIFNEMSQAMRDAPMTRYQLFKVALRDKDNDLASECLQIICHRPAKDFRLLYACVLEAQKSGNRRQASAALQHVTKAYDARDTNGIHLPALYRCTVRIMMSDINAANEPSSRNTNTEVCGLFQEAAHEAERENSERATINPNTQFNERELAWFAGTAYNLAYSKYDEWAAEDVIVLLEASSAFMNLALEKSKSQDDATNMRKRSLVCDALATRLLVQIARAEQDRGTKLHCYSRARSHVDRFRDKVQRNLERSWNQDDEADMQHILSKLLKSDYEASIHLKLWEGLAKIIAESKTIADPKILGGLAEMTLAAEEMPQAVTLSCIEHIIDALPSLSTSRTTSTPTIARWLRILYHLSTTIHQHTETTTTTNVKNNNQEIKSNAIISRALTLADQTKHTPSAGKYPDEELEYLAIATFNRAVDAYCSSDEMGCERLAAQAVQLAERMDDGGELVGVLRGRWGMLRTR